MSALQMEEQQSVMTDELPNADGDRMSWKVMENQNEKVNVKWRNLVWLTIYIVAVACFLAVSIYGITNESKLLVKSTPERETVPPEAQLAMVAIGMVIVLSTLFSIVAIMLVKRHPRKTIEVSFYVQILAAALLFLFGIIRAESPLTILWPLVALLWSVALYYVMRKRLSFIALVLGVTSEVMLSSYGVILLTLVSFLLSIVIIILIAFNIGYHLILQDPSSNTTIGILCVIVGIWIIQYIKYQHYTSICGYMATWYYMSNSMPKAPVYFSFLRANTTSAGSVALGSLVVTLFTAIRCIISSNNSNPENSYGTGLSSCISSIISAILDYANSYVFVYIAIYGKPYCSSVKRFVNLCKRTSFSIIGNDIPIGSTIFLLETCTTILSTAIASYFSDLLFSSLFNAHIEVVGIVFVIIVAYANTSLILSCLECGSKSLFVCIFEDQHVLESLNPELHQAIINTYGGSVFTRA